MADQFDIFSDQSNIPKLSTHVEELYKHILQLEKQLEQWRNDIKLCRVWEDATLNISSGVIPESYLRRCRSLASVLTKAEAAEPSTPEANFATEVTDLARKGLEALAVLFVNEPWYLVSFKAEKLNKYIKCRALPHENKQIRVRILSECRRYPTFGKVVNNTRDFHEKEGQTEIQFTNKPADRIICETAQTGQKRSMPGELDASLGSRPLKRLHGSCIQAKPFYSYGITPKLHLPSVFAPEFLEDLEKHNTWGDRDTTTNIQAHVYDTEVRFQIQWPSELPTPEPDKVKLFADKAWGTVEVRSEKYVLIRSHRLFGDQVVNSLYA